MCRFQLRARGTNGWAVAEGKEKLSSDEAGGIVSKLGRRTFDDGNGRQRNAHRNNPDRRASSIAVTKTAALPRLTVAVLVVMEVPGASVCREVSRCRSVAVRDDGTHLLNGEATVHRTGVQLHRLGQTHGEPQREHAGETTGDPMSAHASNIWWGIVYERAGGADLAIRPRAASNVSSFSGIHSTTHRTVFWSRSRSTIPSSSAFARSRLNSVSSVSSWGRAELPPEVFIPEERAR